MKTLSTALQAHLDTGTTTLALCWQVVRRDATVLGFTEHDRDIVFDSVTYRAASGFTASQVSQSLGLAVDNLEATGALSSSAISEADLAAGLYDDASITIHLVNWADVSQRTILATGSIGEVKRGRDAFAAEIRSIAHRLRQRTGRSYQFYCETDLGSATCGVNLPSPSYTGTGTIATGSTGRVLVVSGLTGFTDGWFTGGALNFTSGVNNGLSFEVRTHKKATTVTLELWSLAPQLPGVGDGFSVTAGCDKTFATCKARFANSVNFHGFPHIPGNDVVQSYPNRGEDKLDGGSLFK